MNWLGGSGFFLQSPHRLPRPPLLVFPRSQRPSLAIVPFVLLAQLPSPVVSARDCVASDAIALYPLWQEVNTDVRAAAMCGSRRPGKRPATVDEWCCEHHRTRQHGQNCTPSERVWGASCTCAVALGSWRGQHHRTRQHGQNCTSLERVWGASCTCAVALVNWRGEHH
jgi:hypothetical protein